LLHVDHVLELFRGQSWYFEIGLATAAYVLQMTDTDVLLDDAARRARRYVSSIGGRAVAPSTEALDALSRFEEPLPVVGRSAEETIALLDDAGSPATLASTGGRYFGFVNGATLPSALAASWLVSSWDQNAALPVMSPAAAKISDVARRWLVEALGLPSSTEAAFVTGATVANATCLAAARDRQLAAAGWDVPRDGLFGAPELTVVAGAQAHSTLLKSLSMVGLGRERVIRVPADDQGRLIASELPDIDGPVVVCAQAGEVNTGAFDPFSDIVEWARECSAWVHVDGAFGLWAMSDLSRAHLVEGLAHADSWATDGHKWLNVTYDCGIAFVRDGDDLRRSFASVAGYLPPDGGYEAMHHTPQSSQRARQVEVWAALRTLGVDGLAALVTSLSDHAVRIGSALDDAGLTVLNDVVLNQVLVRADHDDATVELIAAIQADGTCWCGPTSWAGRPAMRVSVSGWVTTSDDITQSIDAMLRCARQVGAID